MKTDVIFKLKHFPLASETFVVNSIVAAIENGLTVQIISDKIHEVASSSLKQKIEAYELMGKVISYDDGAMSKGRRYTLFLRLLLSPTLLFYFIKYCRCRKNWTMEYMFRLHFYQQYRKVKTIHVHFGNALEFLPDLKMIGFVKSKFIVTFHGYDAYNFPNDRPMDKTLSFFNKYVFKVTVNSDYLRKILVSKGIEPSLIELIPVPVDTNFFKNSKTPVVEKRVFRLLSIGRLVGIKGHSYGIHAVRKLLDLGLQVEYIIVGEGHLRSELELLIKTLQLEDNIQLVGKKNQLEIKDLLTEAALFLMTSTKDSDGREEAFGLVSLEAQSMGLPVIAFDSGGVSSTLLNNVTGLMVEDKNVDALTKAVQSLIINKNSYIRMSDNASSFVREYYKKDVINRRFYKIYI